MKLVTGQLIIYIQIYLGDPPLVCISLQLSPLLSSQLSPLLSSQKYLAANENRTSDHIAAIIVAIITAIIVAIITTIIVTKISCRQ
jgi:hypothetical protein